MRTERIRTDVLIIGGGTAGCFAAYVIGKKSGRKVLIAEKANIKRSGCLAAGVNALNAYITEGRVPQDDVDYAKKDAHGIVREDLLLTMSERLNHVTKVMEDLGLVILKDENEIFGAEIGTLIYGAGKGIIRSFQDFDLCAEPYMKHPKNTIYYFGDMDYEGIGIYENLAEKFRSRWKIIPFVPAYQAMLGKAEQIIELPETKEHQNRNISTQFFSCFDEIMVKKMEAVLDKDRYIPQEILNTADF